MAKPAGPDTLRYNGPEVMEIGGYLMAILDDLTRDLQEILNGVRSSLNYSIENLAEICDDTGSTLSRIEEDLDLTRSEISELSRSLEKIRKACDRAREALLDPENEKDERTRRKSLEKLERLMTLKGQFEEREGALRNRKNDLQKDRRQSLEVLQRAEEALGKVRLSKELLFSPAVERDGETHAQDLQLAVLTLQFAEQERLRLARELHDGPAQLFAAAILLMELVEKLLSMGETARAGLEVERVREQMKDSLGDIRAFLWHLNPHIVEEGLRKGVHKLAEHINSSGFTCIHINFIGSDAKVAPFHAANAFRIIQEAVNNAIKNGHAANVHVRVTIREGLLLGQIEDDGSGFDVETARGRSREQGSFGLANMEERAKLIGGILTLESTPGRGSSVSFRVPIGGGVHLEKN